MRIADYLDTAAARQPDAEAFVFRDVRLTYAQARRYVHAVAHAVRRDPALSARTHAAIYSPNDHRIPMLQLGVNRADRVYIGVHDRNPVQANARILADMDCDLLFFHSVYEKEVAQLKTLLPAVRRWLCIDRASSEGEWVDTWIEGATDDYPYEPVEAQRLASIVPTGGTTGASKGAMHSHHSLEMQCMSVSNFIGMGPGARLLSIAPLSHAAGQLALGLLPNAGTNVILRGFDEVEVLQTIARERITHVFFPPTILYRLIAHPAAATADFSSLQHVSIGAAPVAPEKFKAAVALMGPVVYEGYAQSETLIPVLLKRPSDYLKADGSFDEAVLRSTGRATAFSRVEIMDDEGRIAPRGERGEIVVRASMGMSGYYKQAEASAQAALRGFHHTGDIGTMDARGFVSILDRKSDMIISGGYNVYPAEVEAVVNQHPDVLDCIVVGVPDEVWGEAVKAIVQLKPGRLLTDIDLGTFCRGKLGGVKTPKTYEFWDELPRSAVGKLLRREARKRYWTEGERSI